MLIAPRALSPAFAHPVDFHEIVAELVKLPPFVIRIDGFRASYFGVGKLTVRWRNQLTGESGAILRTRDWNEYVSCVSYTLSELKAARERWWAGKHATEARKTATARPKKPVALSEGFKSTIRTPKRRSGLISMRDRDWAVRRQEYLERKAAK